MKSSKILELRLFRLWLVSALFGATVMHAAEGAIQLVPVLQGLSSPVYVTSAHDGTQRLFVIEQSGRIKVLAYGASAPSLFLDITSKVLSGGEQGLLGLAFHPQFASNSRFFVNYTRQSDGATVIAEYHASTDPIVTAASESILLVIAQPYANHNGGMIEFGGDGYLYIGMGDGGSANDPQNRAQNINELLGKILRIDVDHPAGGNAYSSPPGNPFVGATPGRDEIYAVGMRNPFRFSFDRGTGQLYVGDVGQGALEEVDIVTAGGNYGWRVYEGTQCTNLDPTLCTPTNFIAPIAQYGHTGGRCSITGGYVYRGSAGALPAGTYVFGDYCTGEIFSLAGGVTNLLLDASLNISSFGEDEAGEIYVVGLGGTVHRISATGPTATTTTLATSGSPSVVGANVTFTATVTGTNPTGSVDFTDGGASISGCVSVALSGSGNSLTARCSTSSLSAGTHSIVAAYKGDVANLPSSSTALSQVMNTGTDVVWVDDAVPAGATLAADGGDSWTWINSNPTPYSGSLAQQSTLAAGEHQHYFYNATGTLTVATGDTLFAYVYLDPVNPPSEVMLQWNDGTWEHRAYWGANLIGFGVDGTVSRRYMGALPATGQWVRLSVSAAQVGLEGRTLNGMAYTLYGGRASWDYAGKTATTTATYQVSGTVTLNGSGLSGVNFAATGAVSCTASATTGQYACTVPQGWSGTVTPSSSGYTFTPPSRSYSNVAGNQTTQDYAATPVGSDTVWVDDAVPAGATLAADGGDSWTWINSNPTPYSGSLAQQSTLAAGEHQHYFYNATGTLTVATGDTLFAYVYLDPVNPPSEVMLQWNDGTWEHRAYWGANLIGFGVDGTVSRRYMGALPATGQWVRLSVSAAQVGLEGKTLNGMAYTLYGGRASWDYAGKTAKPVNSDTVWMDDAVPAGATLAADGGDSWTWINSNPTPYSGSLAQQSTLAAGEHQHYFYNATGTLTVATGDTLFAYVYLDPVNPPSEVMLQWNDGTWEHRAYWGANLIGFGVDGTVSRRYMGALPATGQWVRLSVSAAQVGLEGRTLNGMAYTLYGGRASWDYAGK